MSRLLTKANRRSAGAELLITSDPHVIGEDDSGYVYLREAPL